MNPANQVELSDSDSEDIFFGPITKREIMSKLKHYNLCNDELLEPLQKFQDNDVLDDNLIKFYYEDAFPEGSNETDNWKSRRSELSVTSSNLTNAEISGVRNTDSFSACSRLSQDSLDVSNRISLTESELLKKYDGPNELPESHQNSTLSDSVFENNEPFEALNSVPQNSLNVDRLSINESINDKEEVSFTSVSDNESYLDLSSHQNILKGSSIDDRKFMSIPLYETISLNSTLELPKSISINSSPEKSEPVSLNSTLDKSEYSYSNADQSGFNCTLEEMEMFMKFGEKYAKESKDRTPRKSVSETSQTESEVIYSPVESRNEYSSNEKENCSPITRNLQTEKTDNKFPNKLQIPVIPVETTKRNIYRQINTPQKTPKQINLFKTPSPFPVKSVTKKSPVYKNIVSPVAMYIKSTPKVPLVQNVAKKTIHAATFKELNSKYDDNNENDGAEKMKPVLPVRCYKPPSRTVLLSKENEPSMPTNIRKLIKGPLNPEVIKHMGRVHDENDFTPTVSSEDDFTILSSSTFSSSEVQGDVSVYVSKNAARTNRLHHN